MGLARFIAWFVVSGLTLYSSPGFAETGSRSASACTLACPSLKETGCSGGFKCVSTATCQPGQSEIQGECKEAFTMAEVVAALPPKIPEGYSVPYTSLLCETKGGEGWGLKEGKCLPSCEKLGKMWAGTVYDNTPGSADSYIEAKPSFNCSGDSDFTRLGLRCKQGPVEGVYDFPKTNPKGVKFVCCAKICDQVPEPFNYLTQYPQETRPSPPAPVRSGSRNAK